MNEKQTELRFGDLYNLGNDKLLAMLADCVETIPFMPIKKSERAEFIKGMVEVERFYLLRAKALEILLGRTFKTVLSLGLARSQRDGFYWDFEDKTGRKVKIDYDHSPYGAMRVCLFSKNSSKLLEVLRLEDNELRLYRFGPWLNVVTERIMYLLTEAGKEEAELVKRLEQKTAFTSIGDDWG